MTDPDLMWTAGFLEGEGTFYDNRGLVVKAKQVQREPLERLQAAHGGSLHLQRRSARAQSWHQGAQQDIWEWRLIGARARELTQRLYPLMSSRRQEQIRRAMAVLPLEGISTGRIREEV